MTSDDKPQATRKAARRKSKERVKVPPPQGSIADLYREVVPFLDFEAEQTKADVALTVPPDQLHLALASGLRDERLSMDFLRNLTAVDWEERGLELVYQLYSLRHRHSVTIKTLLPGSDASIPTVTDLYETANWAERECREMFGIEFEGHPDPRNLLLDEDLDLHPLRKSHPLVAVEMPQGVDVEYFVKEHPPRPVALEETAEQPAAATDDERAKRIAEAKKKAAGAKDEAKPEADMTPEELAAKRAAQAERVQRARELARARREGGSAPADTPAEASAPSTAAAPSAGSEPAAQTPTADLSPAEREERRASQTERVQRARELAAQRRAQRQKEGS